LFTDVIARGPEDEMKRILLAAALLAVVGVAGCARDTETAINGPDPTRRTYLQGTGPLLTICPVGVVC
jgi:hypothetical protein